MTTFVSAARYITGIFSGLLPATRISFVRQWLLKVSGIQLGEGAVVTGAFKVYGRGKVVIGDHTWVSAGAQIFTVSGCKVVIGCNCDIGPNVTFLAGSHEIGPAERRAGQGYGDDIQIGDGCWIGGASVILAGAVIGSSSVVAAGSVVRSCFESNKLLAGVPAVVKKRLT